MSILVPSWLPARIAFTESRIFGLHQSIIAHPNNALSYREELRHEEAHLATLRRGHGLLSGARGRA